MFLGVVDQQIDVPGRAAEDAQQQRHLTAVMHAVIRGVLEQIAQQRRARPDLRQAEFDDAAKVLIFQMSDKRADTRFDIPPGGDDGVDGRENPRP